MKEQQLISLELVPGGLYRYKAACGYTIGRASSAPSVRTMAEAEHSPIRCIQFDIRLLVYSFVSVHLRTHNKTGQLHFVESLREDRTKRTDIEGGRYDLVRHMMVLNAQHLIDMSRRRLCSKASKATTDIWREVCEAACEAVPALEGLLRPNCVYQGRCYESKPCGYYEGWKEAKCESI